VARFDVHQNPGRRTGRAHPFPVAARSDRWAALHTRLVVPLERLGKPVASFAADEDARRRIRKALDEALSPY
jgi:hypothetical protein